MLLKGIDFFRPNLIECVNISKFENNDMSRCKCTGGGFKGIRMGLWVAGRGGG